MASALVNNVGPVAPEGFLDLPPSAFSSYGWLSPRISFSHELSGDNDPQSVAADLEESVEAAEEEEEEVDLDFEFRQVDDPVAMLPADELFSDGKLVPRQLPLVRPQPEAAASSLVPAASTAEIRSPEPEKAQQRAEASLSDPYTAFSPKAPTCTSRWRELLRLKKAAQSGGVSGARPEAQKSSSRCSSAAAVAVNSNSNAARALVKRLLHRNPRSLSSSVDSSLSLPLLDSEPGSVDSVPVSSRPSLSSSSSSCPDHEDHPRRSLDAVKPSESSISTSLGRNPLRVRLNPRPSASVDLSTGPYQVPPGGRVGRLPTRRAPGDAGKIPARSSSVGSPRMNSSGKVVFQGLGRSSSSPSAITGGPRGKHRGTERSHPAANAVRVAPVLNVPVSMFVLGQFFSVPQKKDSAAGSSSGASRSSGGGGSNGTAPRA